MNRSRALRAVSIILTLGAVALLIWYVRSRREEYAALISLNPTMTAAAIGAMAIYLFLTGEVMLASLALAGFRIDRSEGQSLALIGNAINQFGSFVLGHAGGDWPPGCHRNFVGRSRPQP